jgi:hypothetical protein
VEERDVRREICLPKHQGGVNTANTSEGDDNSGRHCTFTVRDDVVCVLDDSM